jgi:hypothetical protein
LLVYVEPPVQSINEGLFLHKILHGPEKKKKIDSNVKLLG